MKSKGTEVGKASSTAFVFSHICIGKIRTVALCYAENLNVLLHQVCGFEQL
jgi:hypothetical protein